MSKVQDRTYYKDLLKQFITQGLVKMREQDIKIRCLEEDVEIVESVIEDCRDEYAKIMKDAVGVDCTVNITVDEVNMKKRTIPNLQDKTFASIDKHDEEAIKSRLCKKIKSALVESY